MSKKIIFCSDGTWDKPQNATNVYKLYKALATSATQAPYYDDGVGATGLPLEHLIGGAFGTGLFQKVKDGYSQIAQVYEAGDEIFLFGFSRGAYTARSLAGMIAICGLPTQNFNQHLVDTAFRAYRDKDDRQSLLASLGPGALFDAQIKMVGVWDTVGSLGIPGAVFDIPDSLYGFLDTGLHPDVQHAYHALAIDERRREFPPTLWTSTPAPGQILEQVWFSGVHCDVGGSYPETGLSNITLSWMLSKAMALGIEVNAEAASLYLPLPVDPKGAIDMIHESWNLVWGFPEPRKIAANSTISNSVAIRLAHMNNYRPSNLTFTDSQLASTYLAESIVSMPGIAAAARS
ncbi:MAG TPA: DUF2235 domain-containing protein [Bryobacteraceae bacterium]|jgi:uncharacterized protein (DUF2235 family)